MLLCFFELPRCYIAISACFPSSIWADENAAISLVFWFFLVQPCYAIFNITLFIILIVKILGPKKDKKPKDEQKE